MQLKRLLKVSSVLLTTLAISAPASAMMRAGGGGAGAAAAQAHPPAGPAVAEPIDLTTLPGANPEDAETAALLQHYYQLTTEASLLPRLSPEYRVFNQRLRAVQEQYTELHVSRELATQKDEGDDEPKIFQSLREKVREKAEVRLKLQRQEFVHARLPYADLRAMPERDFLELHQKLTDQEALLFKVNRRIGNLIEVSAKSSGYYGTSLVIARQVAPSAVALAGEARGPFVLSTAGDPVLGFSAFELLHYSGEFKKHRENTPLAAGEPIYGGQTEFHLSEDDLRNLSLWLDEIRKWRDDFGEIMAALIGEDSVELGQKSVRELLTDPQITGPVRAKLSEIPAERTTLLFNTVSIDLTAHPHRVYLKSFFEETYARAGLVARNGRSKTFLEGTFRSNIGVGQLASISPRLNQMIIAKRIMGEMFGDSQAMFISENREMVDPAELLKGFATTQLNEVLELFPVPNRGREFTRLNTTMTGVRAIDAVQASTLQLTEDLLDRYSGINFQPRHAPRPEISEEQILALYPAGQMQSNYTGGVRYKNVRALMNTFKEAPLVRAVLAAVSEEERVALLDTLRGFEDQLVGKLNDCHRYQEDGAIYGRGLVKRSIDFLETIVAKVYYAEQSGVTSASVKNLIHQIGGIVGGELIQGCSMGLNGRMSEILSQLVFTTGDALGDAITQKIHEASQLAKQRALIGVYHSSDYVFPINQAVAEFFGPNRLAAPEGAVPGGFPACRDRALQFVVHQINPTAVFRLARQHFGDLFWRFNAEGDDEAMYKLLEELGFGSKTDAGRAELDKLYRINGNPENRWQYAFFQQYLPSRVAGFLVRNGILFPKRRLDLPRGVVSIKRFTDGVEIELRAEDPNAAAPAAYGGGGGGGGAGAAERNLGAPSGSAVPVVRNYGG